MMIRIILLSALFMSLSGLTQAITQNIRGKVVDAESKYPLVGTKLKVTTITDKTVGAVCNENGEFVIESVPIGKQIISVNSIGYTTREVVVILTSGKETIITIELEEEGITGEEVVIEGKKRGEVSNEMATVS